MTAPQIIDRVSDSARAETKGPVYRLLLFGVLALTCCVQTGYLPSTIAAADERADADRWEKEVRAMEEKIASGATRLGRPLFVGSSSIRLWKLDQSFPQLQAVNHGFGGSELSDSVRLFDRIIKPVQPSLIVVYAGDNDIAKGKTADQVVSDFRAFVSKARESLSKPTPILFIAIKPSLSRWSLAEEMQRANRRIQAICSQDSSLTFVDIWQPMLNDQGTPAETLFLKDGLHLNESGYRIWATELRRHLPSAEGSP